MKDADHAMIERMKAAAEGIPLSDELIDLLKVVLDLEAKAYAEGYAKGCVEGYDDGFDRGYDAGRAAIV